MRRSGIVEGVLACVAMAALEACSHMEAAKSPQPSSKQEVLDVQDEPRRTADRMAGDEGKRMGFEPVFLERKDLDRLGNEDETWFTYRMQFLDRRVMNPSIITVVFNRKTKAYSFAAH